MMLPKPHSDGAYPGLELT